LRRGSQVPQIILLLAALGDAVKVDIDAQRAWLGTQQSEKLSVRASNEAMPAVMQFVFLTGTVDAGQARLGVQRTRAEPHLLAFCVPHHAGSGREKEVGASWGECARHVGKLVVVADPQAQAAKAGVVHTELVSRGEERMSTTPQL